MKMLKHICLSILPLLLSVFSFAQHNASYKDTSRRCIDSIITKYEAEGLKLYTDSMYNTAIDKYTTVSRLIDSLFKAKHQFSDAEGYTVTMCNIATCYYKMSCFKQALNVLSSADDKWEQNGEYSNYTKYKWSAKELGYLPIRMDAYIMFCRSDIELAMHLFNDAYHQDISGGIYTLYFNGKFPYNAPLKYRYAINSYSYQTGFHALGDYLIEKGDSVNARLFYRWGDNIDSAMNHIGRKEYMGK
jgi:tetratricopeptide (TPR) repeat protein